MSLRKRLTKSLTKSETSSLIANRDTLPVVDSRLRAHYAGSYGNLGKSDLVSADGSDLVSIWYGLNGTPNLTQGTESLQPEYTKNGLNGVPGLTFLNDSMLMNSSLFDLTEGPNTSFIVSYTNNDTADARVVSLTAAGSRYSIRYSPSAGLMEFVSSDNFNNNVAVSGINKTQPNIFNFIRNGTSQEVYINGEFKNSNALGADATGITQGFVGSTVSDIVIAEIIIYDDVLSAIETYSVLSYLSPKYSINLV